MIVLNTIKPLHKLLKSGVSHSALPHMLEITFCRCQRSQDFVDHVTFLAFPLTHHLCCERFSHEQMSGNNKNSNYKAKDLNHQGDVNQH